MLPRPEEAQKLLSKEAAAMSPLEAEIVPLARVRPTPEIRNRRAMDGKWVKNGTISKRQQTLVAKLFRMQLYSTSCVLQTPLDTGCGEVPRPEARLRHYKWCTIIYSAP